MPLNAHMEIGLKICRLRESVSDPSIATLSVSFDDGEWDQFRSTFEHSRSPFETMYRCWNSPKPTSKLQQLRINKTREETPYSERFDFIKYDTLHSYHKICLRKLPPLSEDPIKRPPVINIFSNDADFDFEECVDMTRWSGFYWEAPEVYLAVRRCTSCAFAVPFGDDNKPLDLDIVGQREPMAKWFAELQR